LDQVNASCKFRAKCLEQFPSKSAWNNWLSA
jgi:hypothetical protein